MAAPRGRIAVGPGAFDQGPAGRGVARLGTASLTTTLSTGVFRRRPPAIAHELSRVLNAGEVAKRCHRGHRDGALDPTEPLEGIDHRGEPPGLDLLLKCLLKALATCRVFGDRLHVFLNNDLRRRGGTDDLAEPSDTDFTS